MSSATRAALPLFVILCACGGSTMGSTADASVRDSADNEATANDTSEAASVPGADGDTSDAAGMDASDATAADASDAARGFNGQLCSQYTYCIVDGGVWTCDCTGGGGPACPPMANAVCTVPTDYCFGCSMGATYTCSCTDAGPLQIPPDAGSLGWLCVGGEQACPQ